MNNIATPDQLIELAEKLQLRRILDEIKKVAAICPSSEFGSPAMEAAWQLCCEEIFYRATGEKWHMDQDSNDMTNGVKMNLTKEKNYD